MTDKKIISILASFFAIVIFLISSKLFAQENEIATQESSGFFINVHFYPASLVLSAIVAGDSDSNDDNNVTEKTEQHDYYFTNIYFTFEFGTFNFLSLVITPSYQGWNSTEDGYEDKGKFNHDRIGSDFGFRIYLTGDQNANGFFLQAIYGIYYLSREIEYPNQPINTATYEATLHQGMGYIGYQYGCVNFSIGIGYNYYKEKKLKYQYSNERTELRDDMTQRGLAFDASFTIKIPVIK
ncbi:MAG: hypothetical protein JXB49_13890 [Bacteroidales bacterium]|nr:hypothetical protein [Bacteroidales bacterium]